LEECVIPNVLSIAGTDPTGGAGIQADLKAFSALGAYGMTVIAAVVAQNTQGVRRFVALDPDFVEAQLEAVFDDVRVDAIKIGMVANAGVARAIARTLRERATCPIVLDPVMVAKSGDRLLEEDAVAVLRDELLPLCTIVTPNLPEASDLLGVPEAASIEQMHQTLEAMMKLGSEWVLLKGGHLKGAESTDLLAGHGGRWTFNAPRIGTRNTHGTGCTLSAALAALIPKMPVVDAVGEAKAYLSGAISAAEKLDVGQGQGPVHHFHPLWR
jgi:hydroxymethylpyrimidine/phosphomethylpyrimidine kinase